MSGAGYPNTRVVVVGTIKLSDICPQ